MTTHLIGLLGRDRLHHIVLDFLEAVARFGLTATELAEYTIEAEGMRNSRIGILELVLDDRADETAVEAAVEAAVAGGAATTDPRLIF